MATIAILGATGAVGREMLATLAESSIPVDNLKLLASSRSAGQTMAFRDTTCTVTAVGADSFEGVDIALFSAGGARSQEWAPVAAKAGAVVIDNSSAFRMDDDVPLIVPEINAALLRRLTTKRIVANPNCSTIQMVLPLMNIHARFGLARIVVSTYQAVSGAGQNGCDELSSQTLAVFNQQKKEQKIFTDPIAFNCIPLIGDSEENGYSSEEMKMVNETQKILSDPDILVSPTTVRVPVFNCHAMCVNVMTKKNCSLDDIRSCIDETPGVKCLGGGYTTQLDCVGSDSVSVGRLRADLGQKNCFNMWNVADNLRKGAALNAVQIAEYYVKNCM